MYLSWEAFFHVHVYSHLEGTMEVRWMEEAREWPVLLILPLASFAQWRWPTSYSHCFFSQEEFIPREGERGGKGCGKRGRGRVPSRVHWRERKGFSPVVSGWKRSSVALWSLFHPHVLLDVLQVKTGGSR